MSMITGKTKSGFEFSISEGLTSDWRYVKAYRNARSADEEKQVDGICSMAEVIFSDPAQEEAFYKHIAQTYGGRVPSKIVWEELDEIIGALRSADETKN